MASREPTRASEGEKARKQGTQPPVGQAHSRKLPGVEAEEKEERTGVEEEEKEERKDAVAQICMHA